MNIKIYLDRYTETCCVPGTQFEQNATVIKFDFSELDFIDDECVKTIHFFHDSLEETNYIGDSIIQNDEFKIPKSITEYENVLAFVQITKEDFIWKTKVFNLDFYKSLDVDKTLDEDQIGILQELILEVQQIKTDTADEYKQLAAEEIKRFNDNAAEKTAEFNENAAEKITEYDNHIEDLDNIVSKNTVNGESIYIDDALEYKVFGAKVDGNVEQTTTTGKNLLKYQVDHIPGRVVESNGVTFTVNEDYSITINGTNNGNNSVLFIANGLTLPPGTYIGNLNGSGWKLSFQKDSSWLSWNVARTFEEETNLKQVYIEPSSRNQTYDNEIIYPMLVSGDTSPGFAKDVYEPYTGGEPSPNPDYPQEITTIKDSVKLLQVGKNLFDTANKEYSLASLDINISNNELLINGTSTGSTGRFVIADNLNLKTSNYIFSFFANNIIPNLTFEFYDLEDNLCKFESANNKTNGSIVIQNHSIKKISAYSNNVQTFSHEIKLQIEEGSVATDYEEYKSNEYDIDLQDNELVKLTDDIKDEITIDKNGNVSLSKRIGKVVLNGTENWIFNESGTNYIRFTLFINDLINNQENNKKYVASDYFVSSSIDEAVTDSADANRICAVSNQRLLIKLVNDNVMNLDDFKAWLSENNVTVYYELAEPTTTSLGQLTNFKTYAGINHFFLETNISTNFEIKYAQDLQKAISKQQVEINELKTLLSSTATSALLLDNYESDLINEIESEVEQ